MKDWVLTKESELRIETFDETSLEMQVVNGNECLIRLYFVVS